jgi:hypothetical protein
MNKLFTWRWVLASLVVTAITYLIVNGSMWGTGHLQALVPSVTIPDLTHNYSPEQLPGFFQYMGVNGRAAYITVNNLDFLFILSNMSFGFIALGTLLRFLMKNKKLAMYLALLGTIPGLCDLIESTCFRVIVLTPYDHHSALSAIAAGATNAKFIGYPLLLLVLLVLFIVTIIVRVTPKNSSTK